jgi:serine/threonine protein kinase
VPQGFRPADPGETLPSEGETFELASRDAALVPGRSLQPGALIANRYRVEVELGRGGGGIVYRAFDQGAQLAVAVKLLNPAQPGAQSTEQLYRELRFGRSIHHPNVCRLYDVFEAQGHCLLVMEYAEAGTLRATLHARGGDRPLEDKLADARGVIAGLAAIHRAGLVHRDLKPENILRMTDGRLVVSDFGLTREIGKTTVTTGLAGTPGYMAPESLTGMKESQASDVWALGVVLHEILNGCRPEWEDTQPPPRITSEKGQDPRARALLSLCRLCRTMDRRRRPASAIQVEALLDKQTVSRPRRRLLAGLTAVAVAAAVAFAIRGGARVRAPSPPASIPLVDPGADWSRSRLIIALTGSFCLEDGSPNRRIVRAVSRMPPTMVDIDPEHSRWTELPASAQAECAARAPDDKAVLFSRPDPGQGKPSQVVLSGPGAEQATPLTAGSHPRWLPSGRAFVFVTPEQRLAVSDLQGRIQLFSKGPAGPFQIRDVAVDGTGQRVAAVATHGLPTAETRLELFDIRTGRQLSSRKLAGSQTHTVKFDPVRRTFQFSEERGSEWVWSELTDSGEVRVLGQLPGRSIDSAVRVAGGFLFTAPIKSSAGGLYAIARDGSEQYISARAGQFRVSPRGDLVYVQIDRSDRRTVILKRRNTPVTALTQPDMFGDPNISADARVVVFEHLLTGEIFSCDLHAGDRPSSCRLVWVDRGLSTGAGLAINAGGDTVAYLARDPSAGGGSLSLRLLHLPTRKARDLARVENVCGRSCQIHWPLGTKVRICPAHGSSVTEVDVTSGRSSERRLPAPIIEACHPQGGDHRYQLRTYDAAEFRFVPDLPESADRKP